LNISFNRKNKRLHKINGKYYSLRNLATKSGEILIIEDVTEKVAAENALKESEEKYRAICENSLVGILIVRERKVEYVNKRFKEILKYKTNEIKRKFFDLIHPDDNREFEKIFNGKVVRIRIFDKNGEIKWMEMGCCKIKYGEDAYLINAIDITRRVEMEKEIREANEKMQRALEKEKKFLEEISHYFFNPLCIAKGYLDLSIPQADPALRRKLEITKQAVTRVENVVKHIVTEGKIYE